MIKKIKLAILISGKGSNMKALIDDMRDKDHPAKPVLIISDRPDATGLEFAKCQNIKTAILDHKLISNNFVFEKQLINLITKSKSEIICLAGFMQILSPTFVETFKDRILNIHPSILPLFKGLHTHSRALESGMCLHGATVHLVTNRLDDGKILGQGIVRILKNDTLDSLSSRVLQLEHKLYPLVLKKFLRGDTDPILISDL